jgi:flavin-binding protein dodecin
MNEGHTYKVIELVGTSPLGVKEAIDSGIARAAETIRGLDWFEVEHVRGRIEDGRVAWYQVEMKIGFRVLSPEELHRD